MSNQLYAPRNAVSTLALVASSVSLFGACSTTSASESRDALRGGAPTSAEIPSESATPASPASPVSPLGSNEPSSPTSLSSPADPATPADPTTPAAPTEPDPTSPTPTSPDPYPNAGPRPTSQCSVTKDNQGFFVRSSGASNYVGYVPDSYSPDRPMRLVVGLHGCGDSASNYATWGVSPYETRATQTHIGISVDGASGNSNCWRMGNDDAKVLAAIDDISTCFWVDQSKVTIAGFSSGGQLAYRVGLTNASRFAGILIESSGMNNSGISADQMLANASWKLNIAHRNHTGDTVFPIAAVRASWAKAQAAGFPIQTSETAGDHNGTSLDWSGWLLPVSESWVRPPT